MKNIYNKGKYRNHEWAKYLRPFLKRIGNKKWRKDNKDTIQQTEDFTLLFKRNSKKRKPIIIKVSTMLNAHFKDDITMKFKIKHL